MAIEPWLPEGYFSARYKFSCTGVENVMSFELAGVFLGDDPPFPAEELNAAFKDAILDNGAGMGTSWTYLGVEFRRGADPGDDELIDFPDAVDGTLGPNTLPPNCCMLIQKRTALAGRRNRGRIFMPPAILFDSEVSDAGVISPAVVVSWNGLFADWRTQLLAIECVPVILHGWDPDVPTAQFLPTTISSFSVQSRIATQRRRLR